MILLSMLLRYFWNFNEKKGGIVIISYEPFWNTLLKKDITTYHLIYKEGISPNTINRMKKGDAITTKTLDTLCFILDCEVSDILRHEKNKWDEPKT